MLCPNPPCPLYTHVDRTMAAIKNCMPHLCPPIYKVYGLDWIAAIPIIPISGTNPAPSETCSEYLKTLDHWELHLFANLEMLVDCYKFIQIVDSQLLAASNTHLLMMSDGLDLDGSMSFSLIIALPWGRQLAQCAGPAFGPYGSSF
jgi:hypothetical protein